MNIIFSHFLMTVIFGSVVFLHIVKKNYIVAMTYGVQSLAIVMLLAGSFVVTGSVSFLLIAILGLIVKVILAPAFIIYQVDRHNLKFLVSTYINSPLTLIVITALTAVAHSDIFTPLVTIIPANHELLSLALSTLLMSVFLIINRKGAISQIVGILSLENSIIAFGVFSVLNQSLILEIGIVFSISVWIIIATVFISKIYKSFGSLDVTKMNSLKE